MWPAKSVLHDILQTCSAPDVLNPSFPRPVRALLPGLCTVADPVGDSAEAPSSRASPQIPSWLWPVTRKVTRFAKLPPKGSPSYSSLTGLCLSEYTDNQAKAAKGSVAGGPCGPPADEALPCCNTGFLSAQGERTKRGPKHESRPVLPRSRPRCPRRLQMSEKLLQKSLCVQEAATAAFARVYPCRCM